MEDPWEAVELDDSDIASSFSLLRRCSRQPPPNSLSSPPPQQPPSPSRRRIPGPAAALQAAMHRKDRFSSSQVQISTQEYIRRVEEDDGEEFSRNPWVFALDSLHRHGMVDTTSLSSIKKCETVERIDKVVAIVKSCAPNGLGDMVVTLKDPSGMIGGSVHRKVLSVGEFGKLISVGSVLILQKVVVFPSSCTSCYLNITRSNVVKVISVDCEVQNFPEANIQSIPEIPEKTSTLIPRTEGIFGDVERRDNTKGKSVFEKLMGKENEGNKISTEPIHIDPIDSCHKALGYYSKWREGDNSCRKNGQDKGMTRNLEKPENAENNRQVRGISTGPCIIENPDSRDLSSNISENIEDVGICGTSDVEEPRQQGAISAPPSVVENLEDIGICGTNDVLKSRQPGVMGALSSMVENPANRKIQTINGAQNPRRVIDTTIMYNDEESRGENGVKKQRLGLISTTSVQEWTDEQLNILDMDED